jgi:dimethylsulfone monooxygenase
MNAATYPAHDAQPGTGLNSPHRLKIGLFSSNLSGGLAVTTVPESWSGNWADNLALARFADMVGLDFILPVARWTGYGGAGHYAQSVLDPVTWAAGILAATRDISVFATIHTAFHHPVAVAKQIATLQEIGAGRAGLNIVCGWNKQEYDMFGIGLPDDHGTRYGLGQEWWDVISRIWASDTNFDHAGLHYTLRGVSGLPRPSTDRPVRVLNAASSAQGREFAVRNADVLFTVLTEVEKGRADVAAIKQAGAVANRRLGVFTPCYVVCRPTRAEAEAYHRHYADTHADTVAVERLMALQGVHSRSFPPDVYERFRVRFAGGSGVYPLVGSPDDVAAELARISEAGFDGVTLSFVNYLDELPYFAAEVLPRLARLGVREMLEVAV